LTVAELTSLIDAVSAANWIGMHAASNTNANAARTR
jgi:hypothetical protein